MNTILKSISAVILVLMVSCQAQNTEHVTVIDQQVYTELVMDMENVQLIDIRTPEEFAEGKIGQAVNINFYDEDFMAQMEKTLDKSQPVIIYCKSGGRSGQAAKAMETAGFAKVYDIGVGYSGWDKD